MRTSSLDGSGAAKLEPPDLARWPDVHWAPSPEARRVDLDTLTPGEVAAWKPGERLLLTGSCSPAATPRTSASRTCSPRASRCPVDFTNRVIYYVGPVDPVRDEVVGPAGPTTATRMDKFTEMMLAQTGLIAMIGKAERGPVAIEAIRKHKAAYLMAVGGAAYLVSKAIRAAQVVAFADLGMEAIYEFEVKDMPVTVAVDASGTSVHETGPARVAAQDRQDPRDDSLKRMARHRSPLGGDTIGPLNVPPVRIGLLAKLNALAIGLIVATGVGITALLVNQQLRDDPARVQAQGRSMVGMLTVVSESGIYPPIAPISGSCSRASSPSATSPTRSYSTRAAACWPHVLTATRPCRLRAARAFFRPPGKPWQPKARRAIAIISISSRRSSRMLHRPRLPSPRAMHDRSSATCAWAGARASGGSVARQPDRRLVDCRAGLSRSRSCSRWSSRAGWLRRCAS